MHLNFNFRIASALRRRLHRVLSRRAGPGALRAARRAPLLNVALQHTLILAPNHPAGVEARLVTEGFTALPALTIPGGRVQILERPHALWTERVYLTSSPQAVAHLVTNGVVFDAIFAGHMGRGPRGRMTNTTAIVHDLLRIFPSAPVHLIHHDPARQRGALAAHMTAQHDDIAHYDAHLRPLGNDLDTLVDTLSDTSLLGEITAPVQRAAQRFHTRFLTPRPALPRRPPAPVPPPLTLNEDIRQLNRELCRQPHAAPVVKNIMWSWRLRGARVALRSAVKQADVIGRTLSASPHLYYFLGNIAEQAANDTLEKYDAIIRKDPKRESGTVAYFSGRMKEKDPRYAFRQLARDFAELGRKTPVGTSLEQGLAQSYRRAMSDFGERTVRDPQYGPNYLIQLGLRDMRAAALGSALQAEAARFTLQQIVEVRDPAQRLRYARQIADTLPTGTPMHELAVMFGLDSTRELAAGGKGRQAAQAAAEFYSLAAAGQDAQKLATITFSDLIHGANRVRLTEHPLQFIAARNMLATYARKGEPGAIRGVASDIRLAAQEVQRDIWRWRHVAHQPPSFIPETAGELQTNITTRTNPAAPPPRPALTP